MKILLVDDQELIVSSIKNGLQWEKLGVEEVYTANNTYEAKFILTNYPVDLLITDIEMPEEDGIALAEWTRNHSKDVVIVFLTSHPSFNYAQYGLRMHIFDYLLQPIRFADLSELILRVGKEVEKRHSSKEVQSTLRFNRKHRNAVYDSIVLKCLNEQEDDVRETWLTIKKIYLDSHGSFRVYPMLVVFRQWESVRRKWSDELIRTALSNVLAEFYEKEEAEVGIANIEPGEYWIFLMVNESLPETELRGRISRFIRQISQLGDFHISCFANDKPAEKIVPTLLTLKKRMLASPKSAEFVWEDEYASDSPDLGLIDQAVAYIREHIYQKLSRKEVAEHIHLNPEYFSKLFRKETGLSFKDFVLKEKMKRAAQLLSNSKLPIGIIASKIGFDNFSHFSQTFKHYYGSPPQEYRQERNP